MSHMEMSHVSHTPICVMTQVHVCHDSFICSHTTNAHYLHDAHILLALLQAYSALATPILLGFYWHMPVCHKPPTLEIDMVRVKEPDFFTNPIFHVHTYTLVCLRACVYMCVCVFMCVRE